MSLDSLFISTNYLNIPSLCSVSLWATKTWLYPWSNLEKNFVNIPPILEPTTTTLYLLRPGGAFGSSGASFERSFFKTFLNDIIKTINNKMV